MGLKSEGNLYVWNVCFEGPAGSLYQVLSSAHISLGRLVQGRTHVPGGLPERATSHEIRKRDVAPQQYVPRLKVVYPDGKVCISILHPAGVDPLNPEEHASERWRPILGVEAIIVSVISMLNDPNLSSPANVDAAKQYKEHFADYKKKVKKLADKSMEDL